MSKNKFEQWVNNPIMLLKNVDPTIKRMYQDPVTEFAWSAWQEQQKVIDELESRMAEADKLMDAAASDGTECVEIWDLYKALRGEP